MIPDLFLSTPAWAAISACSAALAAVLLSTPVLQRMAWATGYLDHPEARKLHRDATPLLGGLGVALGAAVGAAIGFWALRTGLPERGLWWAAGALDAVLMGLVDDRFGIPPAPKMFVQIVAGWLFVQGGVYPQAYFGPFWGAVIAVLWIVGLMNAINFLDNMDGIVGGLAAICAAAFAVLLAIWHRPAEALIAVGLAGAALGFLRYNFCPARIFLGDAGSLFVGYSLGALALISAAAGPGFSGVLASLLVLGYPLFDTTFVVLTRLREGRKIYVGGRDHTTHRMTQVVRGPRRTAVWLYSMAIILAASGIWLGANPGIRYAGPIVIAWGLVLAILGKRLARVPHL